MPGGPLVENSKQAKHDRPDQSDPADHRMHNEADSYVDWNPGRIENRQGGRTSNRSPNSIEVAHHLIEPQWSPAGRASESAPENPRRECFVQLDASRQKNAAAHAVEIGEQKQRRSESDGQEYQSRPTAGGHHSVVHLQHVDRRRQVGEVDHGAEQHGKA